MPEFVSLAQFIDRLGADKAESHFDALSRGVSFTAGAERDALPARAKERFEDDFNKMKAFLLHRYNNGNVQCQHTFLDANGNFVDCLPFDQQSTVREAHKANHTVATKAPDPIGVATPPLGDPLDRAPVLTPMVPPLLRGLTDRVGRRIACPDGCVPIRRFTPSEMAARGTFADFFQKYRGDARSPFAEPAPAPKKKAPAGKKPKTKPPAPVAPGAAVPAFGQPNQHLYATCQVTNNGSAGPYHGCAVGLNVWSPNVGAGVFSLSQLWIVGNQVGGAKGPETIESGWTVFPSFQGSGATDPVLFVFFNPDGYGARSGWMTGATGEGFVQFQSGWVPMSGGLLRTSSPGQANQVAIHMMWVFFGGTNPGWYLYIGSTPTQLDAVGYFPAFLYNQPGSTLGQGFGRVVQFGGEVCPRSNDFRTGQMGSGVKPTGDGDDDFGEVAFCYSMYARTDPAQNPMAEAALAPATVSAPFYQLAQPGGRFRSFFFYGGASAP